MRRIWVAKPRSTGTFPAGARSRSFRVSRRSSESRASNAAAIGSPIARYGASGRVRLDLSVARLPRTRDRLDDRSGADDHSPPGVGRLRCREHIASIPSHRVTRRRSVPD